MRRTCGLVWAWLAPVLLVGASACHRDLAEAEATGMQHAAEVVAAARPPSGSPDLPGASRPSPSRAIPDGYRLMTPVLRTGSFGQAVLLLDADAGIFIPIFIGGTEALSIQLRLDGEPFSRPLTHDLFDAFARELGAKMVRAQVDRIVDGVYIGSVVFERGAPGSKERELFSLDARTSDAIALAIGNGVPIVVAQPVVDEAGVKADDLGDQGAPAAAVPTNPVAL
jgi:bifunctional DNase/RNase